jgi:hypothetical protein
VAAATISSLSSAQAVSKVWRKIQGDMAEGFNFLVEEFNEWLDDYPMSGLTWSQREVTFPVDLNDGYGVALIPDGGYRARPSSVNAEEATASLSNFNATFVASYLSKYADEGNTNQIEKELKFKGAKKIQAMARVIGDKLYGTSAGTLALTDTDLAGTTDTLTLKSGFGTSTISNAAYIADRFRVGDYIAAIDGSDLETNGIGVIGTVTAATPSIAVTWQGSTSETNNDLKIVGANSLGYTTVDDTDYNKAPVGLLDVLLTDTVHGISAASVPRWAAGYSNTSGGQITPARIQAMVDEVANDSGRKVNTVLMAQGVYRSFVDSERAAVRFDSPMNMEIDGSVKLKGVTIKRSRRVPPGYLIGWDKAAYKKIMLTPKPTNSFKWDDGIDLIEQDGMLFPVSCVLGLVCESRAAFGYFSGLTEA